MRNPLTILWLFLALAFGNVQAAGQLHPLGDETRTYEEGGFPILLANAMADVEGIFAKFTPQGISHPETSLIMNGPRGLPQFLIEGSVKMGFLWRHAYLKGDLTITPYLECESRLPGYRLALTFEDSEEWIQNNASGVHGNFCPVLPTQPTAANTWNFTTFMTQGPAYQWLVGGKLRTLLAQQAKPLFDAIEARAKNP